MMSIRQRRWSMYTVALTIGVFAIVLQSCGAEALANPRVVYYQTPVHYQVAPQLQERASFYQTNEYQELLQLRAWRAGFEAGRAQPTESPAAASQTPPTPLPGPEPEPVEPTPSEFAQRYPTLAANCTKCHTGDAPKGDVWLDGTDPIDGPSDAETRDRIARMVLNQKMPRDAKLDAKTVLHLLYELYRDP